MPSLRHRSELLAAITRGHRDPTDFALGLEYEIFPVWPDGRAISYGGPGGVEELLHDLAERSGWRRIEEAGRLLGLAGPKGNGFTLEPGAQLEFNSSPCRRLPELAAELGQALDLLEGLCRERGILFLGLGAQPVDPPERIDRIPKARYDVLEPYLAGAGELGLWMMKTTCGTQVNFDHADAADAARKMRLGFRLAPILAALFANSAVRAGELSGFASWRGHVWTRTDPARCGIPAALCRPTASLEDYVDWALAAPMLFRIDAGGEVRDGRGRSFGEAFAAGEATAADWDLHLSTLFPEVRFRPQLEIRSTDTCCPDLALALAALVKGVFYSESALAEAEALVADWNPHELVATWKDAHHRGLGTPIGRGLRLRDLAARLLDLAVLDEEEAPFLAPLHRLLEDGRSEGEQTADLFERGWEEDPIGRLIEAATCLPRSASPDLSES
ncbi:MAG: gamma-glutamylcysteine synthetase [Planctomycetota bacterium]|nr:MAG: gamma-glutamylcysteine synthetase [Planctomycetota bacterium]